MLHHRAHPSRRATWGRRTAAAAVAVLLAGSLAACGDDDQGEETAQGTPSGPAPVELAADWLVAQRNADGLLENTTEWEGEATTSVDVGSSIDLVTALSATGLHAEEATATVDAVEQNLGGYLGEGREVYAGPSAKALALAVEHGRDPAAFGGVDLVGRVEGAVVRRGPAEGRLRDRSEYGDYANSIGQAFAASALSSVESERAEAVTRFLLLQQCEEGFFRLDFSAPAAKDQSCDGDEKVAAEQAPDTTALVAIRLAGLAESGSASEELQGALERAGAWLLAQQAEDGSFADPTNGTNANTTGLAGWALAELGEDEAAARAAAWLEELQVDDDEGGELADEVGAVAYDEASLEEARTHGLADPLDRSPWVVAGVQALPALAASAGAGEDS